MTTSASRWPTRPIARSRAASAVGPLHGLPTAFKDLEPAVGFRFTKGSPIYKDVVPPKTPVLVERIRRAGAIPIGKTNVPEFGMGSQTYNHVYGTTRNPYDRTKTAGGSCGGAGAALAAGMLPIADGGDLGGSLRNPANFNNIVALAPERRPGADAPAPIPFVGVSVKGPMARSVSDVAFLLSVMAGADARDPHVVSRRSASIRRPLDAICAARAWRGAPTLAGCRSIARVRAVLEAQRKTFEDLGCIVEDACPDFGDVDEIFLTLRTWASWNIYGPCWRSIARRSSPRRSGTSKRARGVTGEDVARALMRQGAAARAHAHVPGEYEFLVCAVNQVPPFDIDEPWPRSIDGVADGELRRVDEDRVLDFNDLPSGDLGAGGLHGRRPAGRRADRRPLSRRPQRAEDRARVRTGDEYRRAPPAGGMTWPSRRHPY